MQQWIPFTAFFLKKEENLCFLENNITGSHTGATSLRRKSKTQHSKPITKQGALDLQKEGNWRLECPEADSDGES
jgi:DNA-binding transcriptional ArsR family regulator